MRVIFGGENGQISSLTLGKKAYFETLIGGIFEKFFFHEITESIIVLSLGVQLFPKTSLKGSFLA